MLAIVMFTYSAEEWLNNFINQLFYFTTLHEFYHCLELTILQIHFKPTKIGIYLINEVKTKGQKNYIPWVKITHEVWPQPLDTTQH